MNGDNNAAGEALRSVGLLLNLTAIVAFALWLSALGTAGPVPSGLAAVVAVGAFLASLLCFAADRRRYEESLAAVPVREA